MALKLFFNSGAVTATALTAGCSSCWKSSRELSRGPGLTAASSQNCSSKKSSLSPIREMRFVYLAVWLLLGECDSSLEKCPPYWELAATLPSGPSQLPNLPLAAFQGDNNIIREWWKPSGSRDPLAPVDTENGMKLCMTWTIRVSMVSLCLWVDVKSSLY